METLKFILSDALWVGTATWAGLAVTLGGFALAFWQLWKTRRASEAAENAARQMTEAYKARSNLADVATAMLIALSQVADALTEVSTSLRFGDNQPEGQA